MQRPTRRHERRRPAVNSARDRLIRQGLPVRRAVRYAREWQAHWEDLHDELLATGVPAETAQAQADQRLGHVPQLVRAAMEAHRRETFGGRHPLLCYVLLPFVLVPVAPVLLVLLISLPLGSNTSDNEPGAPAARETPTLLTGRALYGAMRAWTLVVPAAMALVLSRRARGATLSGAWAWSGCVALAISAGMQRVNFVAGAGRLQFAYGFYHTAAVDPLLCLTVLGVAASVLMLRESHMIPLRLRVLVLGCVALCAGCAGANYDSRVVRPTPPPPVTKLVVVTQSRSGWGRSNAELRALVAGATRQMAGTVVVDRDDVATPDEALRVARANGADRACVVRFGDCGTRLAVPLLPPGWHLSNGMAYEITAYDVGTGEATLTATRRRRNGGMYAVSLPDLEKQLVRSLRQDFEEVAAGADAKTSATGRARS